MMTLGETGRKFGDSSSEYEEELTTKDTKDTKGRIKGGAERRDAKNGEVGGGKGAV
jgi:hypothetical protein